MKIIAGENRGQKLFSPPNDDIRPTRNHVKESIFNIIQFRIKDSVFLDLFAGSGQMGIEALSRGAKTAVFVDSSSVAVDLIKKNLEKSRFTDKSRVFNSRVEDFVSRIKNGLDFSFDIVFLDPPYRDATKLNLLLEELSQILRKGGIILCEHAKSAQILDKFNDFRKSKTYNYGITSVSKYEI